jgi:hypothetical protein
MEDQEGEQDDWLAKKTLQHLGLSLERIKENAKLRSQEVPPVQRDERLASIAVYSDERLAAKEEELMKLMTLYKDRLRWLAEGSHNWFGLVKSRSVVLLMDCSNAALSDPSLSSKLFESLHLLLQEQLIKKDFVHLIQFGSSPSECITVDFTSDRSSSDAKEWIDGVKPSGTCNLLSSLKLAMKQNADTICCVLASKPDQDCDVISDYILQVLTGYDKPKLHFVSCGCDPTTRQMMKFLVREVGGVYHHNNLNEAADFQDTDYERISEELKSIHQVLLGVKTLRTKYSDVDGQEDSSLVHGLHDVDESQLDSLRFLSSPLHHKERGEFGTFERITSKEWVHLHGVERRGMGFYQLLEQDSHQPKEEYISITGGSVQSQVYNVMLQVDWPDGAQRRVHVDAPKVEEYIEQLEGDVGVVQRRIKDLTLSSRREFGVLTEELVVLLVNTSSAMGGYLIELQRSLRKLLQEQFLPPEGERPHVRKLNVGQFSTSCSFWSDQLQDNTPENLEAMWTWIAQWLCQGTVNLSSALYAVLDMICELSLTEEVGVYIVTSWQPDQDQDLLCSFLSQALSGRRVQVHTVYLQRDTSNASLIPVHYHTPESTAQWLLSIADSGYGRFHHYAAGDVVYSDDVHLLQNELQLIQSCQQKAVELLRRFEELCKTQSAVRCIRPASTEATPTPVNGPLPLYPRHTLTSVARLNLSKDVKQEMMEDRGVRGRSAPTPDESYRGFYLEKGLRKGFIATISGRKAKGHSDLQALLGKAVTRHCSSSEVCIRTSIGLYVCSSGGVGATGGVGVGADGVGAGDVVWVLLVMH